MRAEAEPRQQQNSEGVEQETPASAPELASRPEEPEKGAAANGEHSSPAPEAVDALGPSDGSQEQVQPPDITRTIGQSQPDGAGVPAEGVRDCRPADILDQVPMTDRPAQSDSPGPMKPPRQFTVEPDIVASTKKPPPSRPPPPGVVPPRRPPPPAWPSLPSKKSQESLRPSGLEGRLQDQNKHSCIRFLW